LSRHSMSLGLSQEQYCFSGSNSSCFRAQFSVETKVTLQLIFSLGMLITILGNSVVIVSIGHFKQLHNPTNVLIVSLAYADLLVGVTVMPFSAIRTIHGCWFYGEDLCLLHSSFDMFLTTVSIFHLICIAIDRQQAICNPLHYSRNITISVAWIMVCASWALAAIYSHGLIYSKANVHVRKIEDMSKSSMNKESGGLIKQSEHKAAKTLGIVLGGFIFCWMPFFLNSIIDAYTGFSTSAFVFEALVWLGYFNSTLNPIIYALFYPCFKKCFCLIVNLKIFNSQSSTIKVHILTHV
uniref:G-protein coupled receptors family 1 profile domain-containing protein n=1 Tax=Gasterosteus aculeatus aculeatus TaxID=481459 RepID=A0AAQ4NPP3_GASAC